MYAVCELNVRTPCGSVSASGQSQAVSMWAWPMAESSCTCGRCGWRAARRGSRAASSQLARSSSTQTLQKRFSSAQQPPGPRSSSPFAGVGLQPAEHVEVVVQLPRLAVEAGDLAAVEHHRLERRVGPVELRRTCRCRPARRAGRAARRRPPRSSTGASIRAPSGLDVQALDGAPADPQRRLAVADPEQVDALAGPLLRARSPRPGTSTSPTAGRSCSPSAASR